MTKKGFKNNSTVLFILLIMVLVLYFLFLMYGDTWITHHYSLEFMDCLFKGEIRSFYKNSVTESYKGFLANYYWSIYFLMGVWNLPVWFLTRFAGANEMSIGCMIWIKLFLALFAFGCAYHLRKILINSGKEKEKVDFAVFLFLSSLLVAFPAFYISQIDVVSLFFVLWGIQRSVNKDKISWKTIALFAIASTFKLFAIFPFVIFVLLYEKKIIHIIKELLCGLLGIVLMILPWIGDESFGIATASFEEGFIDRMMAITLPGGMTSFSIFFAVLFSVLIISYGIKLRPEDNILSIFSWLNLFLFIALFGFMQLPHPYWIVIMAPYPIFLIAESKSKLKLNMLLEMGMELSITLVQTYVFNWVYLNKTAFSALFLKNVPEFSNTLSLESGQQLMSLLGLDKFVGVIFTLFLVCGAALLVVNNPWRPLCVETDKDRQENELVMLCTSITRLLIIASYFILIFLIAFFI